MDEFVPRDVNNSTILTIPGVTPFVNKSYESQKLSHPKSACWRKKHCVMLLWTEGPKDKERENISRDRPFADASDMSDGMFSHELNKAELQHLAMLEDPANPAIDTSRAMNIDSAGTDEYRDCAFSKLKYNNWQNGDSLVDGGWIRRSPASDRTPQATGRSARRFTRSSSTASYLSHADEMDLEDPETVRANMDRIIEHDFEKCGSLFGRTAGIYPLFGNCENLGRNFGVENNQMLSEEALDRLWATAGLHENTDFSQRTKRRVVCTPEDLGLNWLIFSSQISRITRNWEKFPIIWIVHRYSNIH
jgi:hypothetical protein